MKINILLASIICFVLTLSAFGQTLQDRIAKVADKKEFEVNYDKFKDRTTLGTHIMFRYPRAKISVLQCDIRAAFQGTDVTGQVDQFYLIFSPRPGLGLGSGGSNWQFLRNNNLIFLLDGTRLDMGKGTQDGLVYLGGVKEWVVFKIGREDLQKLADAKKVEIQLGHFEGEVENKGMPRVASLLALTAK